MAGPFNLCYVWVFPATVVESHVFLRPKKVLVKKITDCYNSGGIENLPNGFIWISKREDFLRLLGNR
jgi:hypothetical protein